MIFSRRAIQRMLDDIKPALTSKQYLQLLKKLNFAGPYRLPAMWEVAVMAQLAKMGSLIHEKRLPNGKRPDVFFRAQNGFELVADVTTVSDKGVDKHNPYDEFSRIIEEEKRTLGLGIGGVNLEVREEPEVMREGTRRRLRLPPHAQLRDYVRTRILPELKRQQGSGQWPLEMTVDDETASFRLKIADGPYSTASYGSYDRPTIVRQNPLFYKLQEKADGQLRDVPVLAGVIACDGDCVAMKSGRDHSVVSTDQIVKQFLIDNPHIGFVLILSVKERQRSWADGNEVDLSIDHQKWMQPGTPAQLKTLLAELAGRLPAPVNSATNAAYRALEKGFGRGHGKFGMGGRSMQIGARHVMEILAGVRTVEDFNRNFGFRSLAETDDVRRMPNPFEVALSEGRLPANITIEETGENGRDHVLNIEFGAPDPALSEFR